MTAKIVYRKIELEFFLDMRHQIIPCIYTATYWFLSRIGLRQSVSIDLVTMWNCSWSQDASDTAETLLFSVISKLGLQSIDLLTQGKVQMSLVCVEPL